MGKQLLVATGRLAHAKLMASMAVLGAGEELALGGLQRKEPRDGCTTRGSAMLVSATLLGVKQLLCRCCKSSLGGSPWLDLSPGTPEPSTMC